MCDFKPGDEVVCVDDRRVLDLHRPPAAPLQRGASYTVLSVYYRLDTGCVCIRLAEQKNPSVRDGRDLGFRADRFRKVQRRKTDLSIESFLTIKPGFEEPRRPKAPAKKERA